MVFGCRSIFVTVSFRCLRPLPWRSSPAGLSFAPLAFLLRLLLLALATEVAHVGHVDADLVASAAAGRRPTAGAAAPPRRRAAATATVGIPR